MRNFITHGNAITITASSDVASGAGVLIGSLFGVAADNIASGREGTINVIGIYDLPKVASQAWTVGALIYWNGTACTNVAGTNKLIGVAVAAVGGSAADKIGRVRLNGAGLTA